MTATDHFLHADDIRTGTRMTEQEFESWALATRARAEWVNGEVVIMAPANADHWEISSWLVALMAMYASKHKLGKAGGPELMNRFEGERRVPDVLFIKKDNLPRLKRTYIEGGADLIVEVVSPDSVRRDWRDKYLTYQRAGVPEYWIIDPNTSIAEFYHLHDGKYQPIEITDGILRSVQLAGFWLKVEWLWQRPLPEPYDIAHIIGIH